MNPIKFFKRLSVTKKVMTISITLLIIGYIFCLPRQLFHVPYSTVVTDRNEELLGARIASDGQWRFPPRKTTPEKIKQCLITFEDKHFYHHWGVNPLATGRALYQNLKNKRVVSGGSTLTMQTIRQALMLLRQNPLLSTIFLLGTAFAITMIMAIVITWQMKYADIEPEVNRNRSLYISKMHLQGKENKGWNNYTACSPAFMKDCVQPLPEVEACTAFVPASVALVSMPDGTNAVKVDAMETDPGFWKVFRMQFVAGRGFDDSDRGGDVSAIVVAASVARKLFGTTDAVGKTVLLNRNEARICGVVKDVSVIAKDAYAQVWRMYPAKLQDATSIWSYAQSHTVVALARSSEDIPAIRQGIAKRVKDINAVQTEVLMDIMEQPDEIVTHVNHVWANVGPDLRMLYIQYALALLIVLLVPSLNLCGLSNSRMQQRISELGVRKAFGATRGVLIRQILNENLVLTLIGGVVGLVFSYLAVYGMRTWLFTNNQNTGTSGEFDLSMSVLFSPTVFCLAFLFCLVINLLSAGLPTWLAARHTIVDSLNDK